MNDNLWRQLQPPADRADEVIERFLASAEARELKAAIRSAAAIVPDGLSVSLDITLNVFDRDRGRALPLLTTGLACSGRDDPYVTPGDSAPCRYLVEGEICEVPHDHCPHCWANWDFKIGHPMTSRGPYPCPSCKYELGKEVKLMLDNDRCPHCDEGTLSMANPTCDNCGFVIDSRLIAWGYPCTEPSVWGLAGTNEWTSDDQEIEPTNMDASRSGSRRGHIPRSVDRQRVDVGWVGIQFASREHHHLLAGDAVEPRDQTT